MIDANNSSAWAHLTEPSVLIQALIFLTLVATWLRSSLVARRDRRWAREDRARAAVELKELGESTRVTHTKLDENTQISSEALREANNVNLKIKSITEALHTTTRDAFELSKKRFEDNERRFEEARRKSEPNSDESDENSGPSK